MTDADKSPGCAHAMAWELRKRAVRMVRLMHDGPATMNDRFRDVLNVAMKRGDSGLGRSSA